MKVNLIVGLLACCSMAAMAADSITGVARNQTVGLPAAGDEVILLRLDQSMQEEARTRTDQHGTFSFNVHSSDKLHLVRLIHHGVNYDQRVSIGDAVSIDVFDAAAKVQGVTGSIEIIRIGGNGNSLHVSDMIEIRNDSAPPLTQASERTFDVYLPPHAKIDSVLAASSDKIGVMITAAPAPGEPGHYTVNFPLRPGTTKFSFNYDLPYRGRAVFRPRSVVPLQQLAVMIPPSMKFTSRASAFRVLPTDNNSYQVEAASQLKAGEGPGFEISGVGTIPAAQARVESPAKPPVTALPAPGPAAPDSSRAQVQAGTDSRVAPPSEAIAASSPLRWFVLGAASVLLPGVCGFLLFRRRQKQFADMMTAALQETKQSWRTSLSLVETLKDEIFQLEIERMQGTISQQDYASVHKVLEGTIKHALERAAAVAELPPQVPSFSRTEHRPLSQSIPIKSQKPRSFSINA